MYFRNLRNPLIKHYYCARCLAFQKNNGPGENCTVCESAMDKSNKRYFLEMPIENQLKNLFAQNGFYNNLQGRFRKSFNNSYEDITDGTLYRQLYNNDGPLSSSDNLSFVLNTDGAPVFKSSKVSIWPVFLVINELPFKIRMKKENMILAALWFGNEKPAMGTFLKPLQKSFLALKDGIKCFSPERGEFLSKCFLLAATADLPARSLLCNSVQFNGKFGCWKCTQPGETAPVGKGHTHVFPFQKEDPMGPVRTAESVKQNSIQALRNAREKVKNPAVCGVKGPSWISYFPHFDCVQGIAIDYMHGVLLGVQKLLLTLWFSPKHKNRDFSISDQSDRLNNRLENIHPTLDITQLPRSITDMKYWKASEYRSFLLYYGGPVMYGLLNEDRFNHYMCLVNAVHILLGNGSSVFNVNRAERMLLTFCEHFENLYSRSFMTLNVHQLVHMAQGVRCLGPLYTHSCFPFEDKNGFILKLIRGTQNIDNQIITGVSFIQKMPELKQNCLTKGSDVEKLCHSIENPHPIQRGEKICDGAYVLGGIKQRQLLDDEYDALCRFTGTAYVTDNLPSFMRLEKDNCLIYGIEYARMTKRDNSTIMFTGTNAVKFGRVRCFLKLIENIPVAVVEELNCLSYNDRSNLLSVKQSGILTVVPVDSIKMLCMLINIEGQNQMFVCKFPNRLECD
ncbi:uncharacterized protein LOC133191454 [Saccostrea echinata]|uniref:uncharacterized protein LOC133191454 n=1 Tax=Saccostrea echinata TaxID=191078 RepID=UPI002A81C6FD|nr:uncharacterized protein LOC133191454 [Saccostrea echinata]